MSEAVSGRDTPSQEWYHSDGSHVRGPIAELELIRLYRQKKIEDSTLVWQRGMADWQPVADVDRLAEAVARPPALPVRSEYSGAEAPPPLPPGVQSSIEKPTESDSEAPSLADDGLGWLASRSMLLMAVLSMITGLANAATLAYLFDLAGGATYDQAQADSVDEFVSITSGFWVVGLIISATLFIRFLRQLYDELEIAGIQDPPYGKGWAAWGWFVPVFFLFRPYQVVRELWRLSANSGGNASSPPFLSWWLLWIAGNLAAWASMRLMDTDDADLDAIIAAAASNVGSDIAMIIAAFLAYRILRDLGDRVGRYIYEQRGGGSHSQPVEADLRVNG